MKMLGKLGWHGQCDCCCGKNGNKEIKRQEEIAWRREYEMDDKELDDFAASEISRMMELGIYYDMGLDDNGELVMKTDMAKMKKLAPEYYQAYLDDLNKDLDNLVSRQLAVKRWDTQKEDFVYEITPIGVEFLGQNA